MMKKQIYKSRVFNKRPVLDYVFIFTVLRIFFYQLLPWVFQHFKLKRMTLLLDYLYSLCFFFRMRALHRYRQRYYNKILPKENKTDMLKKIKSVFKSKPTGPIYKHYTAAQLKIIAMKSRIVLDEYYKKSAQKIKEQDSVLTKNKNMSNQCYRILQEIGKLVIDLESIKIYIQLLKKIEDKAPTIIKTNGDIALMKTQLQWFQAILWFRKCREFNRLQEINEFCFNFFKGIDVTMEINVKCQIFQIYPILKYLQPDCVLPLKKLEPQISNYITTMLDEKIINEIFSLNRVQIRMWFKREKIEYQQKFLSKSKSKSRQRKSISPVGRPSDFMSQSLKPLNKVHEQEQRESQMEIQRRKKQQAFKNSFMRRPDKKNQTNEDNQSQNSKIKDSKSKQQFDICEQCGKKIKLQTSNIYKKQQQSDPLLNQKMSEQKFEDFDNSQLILAKSQSLQYNQDDEKIYCTKCLKEKLYIETVQKDLNADKIIFPQEQLHQINENSLFLKNNEHQKINQGEEKIEKKQQFNEQDNLHASEIPDTNLVPNQPKQQEIHRNIEINENHNHDSQKPDQGIIDKDMNNLLDKKIGNQLQGLDVQNFNDQQESLEIIRSIIKQKPKFVKKPYMVSIYARAEYIGKHQ